MSDWIPLLGMFITVIGLLFGFFRWFTSFVEQKHKEHWDRVQEQDDRINARLDDHRSEFERIHKRLEKNEARISETRDNLHESYVKQSHIEKIHAEIRQDFNTMFNRLDGLTKSVNRIIGGMGGSLDN